MTSDVITPPAASRPTSRRGALRERLRGLPRPVKWLLVALLVLFLYLLPVLNIPVITTPDSDFGAVLTTVALYALVAVGLNVVLGYAGLLDLGYVGFYAVGAYTVAVLGSLHGHVPFLLLMLFGAIVSTATGLLLGAPTLRVRGDYLAIVTLGFGEIIRLVALNSGWLGGAAGITGVPRPPSVSLFQVPSLTWNGLVSYVDFGNSTKFLEFGVVDQIPYYWLALTVIFVIIFADKRLQRSRVGRAWEATREDEDAAELMGVPTFKFKLTAFAIGAFVGGLSGTLFAAKQGFVNPDTFIIQLSIFFVAAVVLGGQGNRWGVIVGAIVVAYLPERFRGLQDFRVLIFGIILLLLTNFRYQGLLPPRRTVRAKALDERLESLEEGTADA